MLKRLREQTFSCWNPIKASYLFAWTLDRIPEFHDLQHIRSADFPGSAECLLIHRAELSAPTLQQTSGTEHGDTVYFSERSFTCLLNGKGKYLSRDIFLTEIDISSVGRMHTMSPKNWWGSVTGLSLGRPSEIGGEFRKRTGLTGLALISLSIKWDDSISCLSHR